MRPLDEPETTQVLEKLHKFVGLNLKDLIERSASDGPDEKAGGYCFRLHKQRVYYVSESLVRRVTNISRDKLCSLGTCLGKFTKSGKFRLTVTCLDLLAKYAKFKIWLKPSSEMSFLYGNHVTKSGLGRITDNTPQYQGVVTYSMSDIPLGFGLAAKSTQDSPSSAGVSSYLFAQAILVAIGHLWILIRIISLIRFHSFLTPSDA